eukprot:3860421-Amphidinium_carterae.1
MHVLCFVLTWEVLSLGSTVVSVEAIRSNWTYKARYRCIMTPASTDRGHPILPQGKSKNLVRNRANK